MLLQIAVINIGIPNAEPECTNSFSSNKPRVKSHIATAQNVITDARPQTSPAKPIHRSAKQSERTRKYSHTEWKVESALVDIGPLIASSRKTSSIVCNANDRNAFFYAYDRLNK